MIEAKAALTRVPGFRAVGVTCGLKVSGKPDLALVLADRPCTAAAVFTTNHFKAAPVLYDMALIQRAAHALRGVIVNAGNANAVTGEQGLLNAATMAHLTEEACGLPADSIFVMSTGVIGEPLPMDKVRAGVRQAGDLIQTEAGQQGQNAVQAIMTTDLVPKEAFVQITVGGREVKLAGMAKGSGMIHPDMATMLAVLVTDAVIEPGVLDQALRLAVGRSFHRVTVDGDTSTNDTVLVLASGGAEHSPLEAGSPDFETFVTGLSDVCIQLAKAVARDGEGATKLIEITVRGARTEAEAAAAARTIAISPLFKTAVFGNDPNWGRVFMALGRAPTEVDPRQVSLWLGDFHLVDRSEPLAFDETAAHNWLAASTEISLVVDLALGSSQATVWTCDYSYKYVEINAEYHT
ncbi:MAG TPA: bifunctional glutamate N-acetyltransferase/amino-acid acetyltransferase ArgJ [Anaerolineae bacterium]|nr:bifunctional glutamate N-acetyltransferase/amino-acid acetyltransferase ArgJ [Anaerolineae bacterium]HMR66468.1 bifunctional glutamate N-acetyltransferase/amino-acid acetyltransferase ArgJ [Anaerolineae bacterium]